MKFAWLAFLMIPAAHAGPAFRGYSVVEGILSERLLADGANFSFRNYYLKNGGPNVDAKSLLSLLGTYDEASGEDAFKNGDPNSVNMLLWQLMLELAGHDVAARCQKLGHLRVNPFFQAALDPLCQWPAPAAKTDSALRGFWTAVMGYDAPEEEFLAWQRFALTSKYASLPASEAVPALFLLIAYDPYFLLRN